MSNLKPRNYELALIAKNDCTRFKIRVIESEKKKREQVRSRKKKSNRLLMSDE